MCGAVLETSFKRKQDQLKKWVLIAIFYETLLLTTSKLYILHCDFCKLYPKSQINFYNNKNYG